MRAGFLIGDSSVELLNVHGGDVSAASAALAASERVSRSASRER